MIQTPSHNPSILIVDDDSITRISLKATVESFGYCADVAKNGEEAFEMMRSHHYRIVLSDWEMPGMSGPELCKKMRDTSSSRYTYFILLTSHSSPDHIVHGLEAGADDFISKPFNQAELRVRIKSAERIEALDTMDITIFAMAKLAESRDPETGAHLERVRQYVRIIARELKNTPGHEKVDEEFIRLMYATSPLHDIGKVAIPDSILLKPGQLNDQEFEIMKFHAIAGAETLKAALDRYPEQRFLQMAHDIARSHHERFDGSGYPDGLSGEEIPLSARIMALADVYDSLTSKRVYKDAFTHKVASDIIFDGAGSHFDPQIVMIFGRVEAKFERVRLSFMDQIQSAA